VRDVALLPSCAVVEHVDERAVLRHRLADAAVVGRRGANARLVIPSKRLRSQVGVRRQVVLDRAVVRAIAPTRALREDAVRARERELGARRRRVVIPGGVIPRAGERDRGLTRRAQPDRC